MTGSIKQNNYYRVVDGNGRNVGELIVASNIQQAYAEAKLLKLHLKYPYMKIKRCYSGGVRG